MKLTHAQQELVAIGASVGSGCHPCLTYHLAEAARAGLAREAIFQALADAECVKRSAYNEQAVLGRELLNEEAELPPSCCEDTSAEKEYVSLGSAIGANSIAQFQKHAGQAQQVGIDPAAIAEAVTIARQVQARAAEITAEESARIASEAPPKHAPVFLTADVVSAGSEEACGDDCACNEAPAAAETASACGCGEDERVPVVAGTAPGKCC
jgi:AhpD family alkylhydroperoxidase